MQIEYGHIRSQLVLRVDVKELSAVDQARMVQDLASKLLQTDMLSEDDLKDWVDYMLELFQHTRPNHPALSNLKRDAWYK